MINIWQIIICFASFFVTSQNHVYISKICFLEGQVNNNFAIKLSQNLLEFLSHMSRHIFYKSLSYTVLILFLADKNWSKINRRFTLILREGIKTPLISLSFIAISVSELTEMYVHILLNSPTKGAKTYLRFLFEES